MLYDFKCPHGHMFEHTCRMDDRNSPVPCEGHVNQVVEDELFEEYSGGAELPEDLAWVKVGPELAEGDVTAESRVLIRKVPCQLKAELHVGTHNNPAGALDHGLGSNRDAAREGRYDPLNPNRRFMAKGRGWRK